MGDLECGYLLKHGVLPSTQPYQAIIEGERGRTYAEKYLRGHKSVDTSPTTVVEFTAPRHLIATLFEIQHKVEDGALSMGLGDKAGKGLPLFNASLASGETTYRIVLVKRQVARSETFRGKSPGGRKERPATGGLAHLTAEALTRRGGKKAQGEPRVEEEPPPAAAPSLRKQLSDEGKRLLTGSL
mmetsp:Transcript_48225/g.134909  ORF Transcript_48225/g.134909 Transcript_48225/m.134909 type:complete len:185 (-) Transcript_48225:1512-2066(-)